MTFTVSFLCIISRKMTNWLSKLEQLDISDGAIAGLSNVDRPIIKGRLLQSPAGDRLLFFRGQKMDVSVLYAARKELCRVLLTAVPDFGRKCRSLAASFWSSGCEGAGTAGLQQHSFTPHLFNGADKLCCTTNLSNSIKSDDIALVSL